MMTYNWREADTKDKTGRGEMIKPTFENEWKAMMSRSIRDDNSDPPIQALTPTLHLSLNLSPSPTFNLSQCRSDTSP